MNEVERPHHWNLIIDSPDNACNNMRKDMDLFSNIEANEIPATLRIYSWDQPCITYGYSQSLENDFYIEKIPNRTQIAAKRPTGGGIVFHNSGDLTYSIVTKLETTRLPKGIEQSCTHIHKAIAGMLLELGIIASIAKSTLYNKNKHTFERICFATPARYELVTIQGQKIAGSAQKRGKKALLQQGTIPFSSDYSFWIPFCKNTGFITSLKSKSADMESLTTTNFTFDYLAKLLAAHFEKNLGIILTETSEIDTKTLD
ncbi:MAG: hypothetical protein DKM50_10295 [Candidatus Margulisiibacteriota bacterium]|nr:MAG: hypothetical protein A2X43_06320 [Candidatus Margulisbacteria bacterium GWD2_39_127]OGI05235.1 MAG: hypothetical protein A2X42_02890 [Candidatus Margulisbacteria bacterium GWF2_38_17]OGI06284.1 MAG: hypothetical protein A2X41_08470 [Candidatus Margulisbacteria bacterium GWE2_39_32]PZM78941.1 MAG: hypothetical protein DKM50_10295 [Candidatus Margulisiibacteriota bacterium]HAR64323.1 hypothetical protein [Candidatus Margulisiibacteriota bacterium]